MNSRQLARRPRYSRASTERSDQGGLIHTCDIGKGGTGSIFEDELGPAFAKVKNALLPLTRSP